MEAGHVLPAHLGGLANRLHRLALSVRRRAVPLHDLVSPLAVNLVGLDVDREELDLVIAGRAWDEIGVTDMNGTVSVQTTDPARSNSGLQFSGLLANVLNGGRVVDSATVQTHLPEIRAFFAGQGFMVETSGDLFAQFLVLGRGAAPIVAGLDKFTDIIVQWEQYLTPPVAHMLPVAPETFMRVSGVVEIAAGLLVAFRPAIGGYVVALWLWGIIVNLLLGAGYYDIALRDLGLSLGALALARLSLAFRR